ncbi:unnamed protein product [Adineta ricciae]|uniref:Uncharacterized protein n=1 Tax=Adineta ricciae TaxID=249248 RepID=A0A814CD83_ADIRI|nr:unnamed protein product [Adineta ricciae]
MNAMFNTNTETKSNILQTKSSIQADDSYRIFRITKKQNDDSDDENIDGHHHMYILYNENSITSKPQRKSIKNSDRHGFDGWKRKSTKNKRLLFLHKTSCDSTSNEAKIPSSPSQITTDLSPSINSNDASLSLLSKKDEKQITDLHGTGQSFESDVLGTNLDGPNDAALNNLLVRADQLETTVKKQDFNKIQRVSRTSIQQKRKRCLIACSTISIALMVIIAVIVVGMVMILKHRTPTDQVKKPSSIYDLF